MLESGASANHGTDFTTSDHSQRSPPSLHSELSIPKNRSTGNLAQGTDKPRIRFSFDAGMAAADYDTMSRSPIMAEHEHGLGTSGLRRIRQQPPPRAPNSEESSRHASISDRSMTLPLPGLRGPLSGPSSGAASPKLSFTEDLTRFPSESLHSFSFAHQSEEFMTNRQNVLKRSVEFMSQKLGWGTSTVATSTAKARLNGDQEAQGMLELLARANLVGGNNVAGYGGPLTGPASTEVLGNVFDDGFIARSQSPEELASPGSSPEIKKATITSKNRPSGTEQSSPIDRDFEPSSRSPTTESRTTAATSPPGTRPQSLKRTSTDLGPLMLQNKLMDTLAEPYMVGDRLHDDLDMSSPRLAKTTSSLALSGPHPLGPAVHGHSSRWAPAAQAIFTTESTFPYTILAANDLACLVFGVTKAEVRKMGILEVVQEERRAWLEDKLTSPGFGTDSGSRNPSQTPPQGASQRPSPSSTTSFLLGRAGGVTASLLNRPNSRQVPKATKRAQTDDGAGSSIAAASKVKGGLYHPSNKSRGVLLCGDVVPIQKRNGATGSASLWVKEKKAGLIWVLEEINEDVAIISMDEDGKVKKLTGSTNSIWGESTLVGKDVGKLIPKIPRQGMDGRSGEPDFAEISKRRHFTARSSGRFNIPVTIDRVPGATDLRISSFPHIAGIMVLSPKNLEITSSNSVFSAALFGQEKPDGHCITDLIPDFERLLKILTEEDGLELVDGIVIPEYSFRRAKAFLALRDGKTDAASFFLRPNGISGRHRDGSEIRIDAQLRVVKSESTQPVFDEHVIEEQSDEDDDSETGKPEPKSAVVYALWITYSRHIHAAKGNIGSATPLTMDAETPLRQPSPGQTDAPTSPIQMDSDEPQEEVSHASMLAAQLKEAARKAAAVITGRDPTPPAKIIAEKAKVAEVVELEHKKTIDDFVILEEMGQGAYGQVKLARYKKNGNKKMVLKYVTKRRILVDTWTRDRRLGTVPLEIHVLDYLRRDGLRHPNIVEMSDFFEDDVNYYIEMIPHGLPGMDLFDYIELRVNMEENECRSIFVQVARAIHHLHTKALVVHRDIKDENVVLDGDGNIKLIDFGSAAYIKNGPFDVFVGTIDYAAPEVLAGKSYRGKEQDVWALGILLYTIVYKENPFYSIDEIMDRDLRVPYVMSEDSIDLIRGMLNREVDSRITIEQVMEHPWCLAIDN